MGAVKLICRYVRLGWAKTGSASITIKAATCDHGEG
jgi:hypothetical protein